MEKQITGKRTTLGAREKKQGQEGTGAVRGVMERGHPTHPTPLAMPTPTHLPPIRHPRRPARLGRGRVRRGRGMGGGG